MDYPLMGVIKVEYPNPTAEAIPSEIIDEISSALVAERQVTPHGRDIRWSTPVCDLLGGTSGEERICLHRGT